MEILAYVLSILGQVLNTSASLVRGSRMKLILLLVFAANTSFATSYLLNEGGINGAVSCYLGGILAIVNFWFTAKNRPFPKWLPYLYGALFVAVNVIFGTDLLLTAIAIAATLCFVLGIGQATGAKYRFWTLGNLLLWVTFDIFAKSLSTLWPHLFQVCCTVLGMVIYDRKKAMKK